MLKAMRGFAVPSIMACDDTILGRLERDSYEIHVNNHETFYDEYRRESKGKICPLGRNAGQMILSRFNWAKQGL